MFISDNMDNKEEIIYFSVNNWFAGRDYPNTEKFYKWLGNRSFMDDDWCRKNMLCVYYGPIDMSINYTIAAPRSWVEQNCPELLTDDEYTYHIRTVSKDGEKTQEYKKKYSDFVDHPSKYGYVTGRFGWPYPEYNEENLGSHYYEDE